MTGVPGVPDAFPVYGEADWRSAVEAALKGASFDRLISQTSDGIRLQPLYPGREGPRAIRGDAAPWRAFARVDHPDPGGANEQALEDLAGGADGLQVVFAGAGGAYGFGLGRHDSATLHRAFEGVRFPATRFELDLGAEAEAQAIAFAGLVERLGEQPSGVSVAFGLDPIGALARSGRAASSLAAEGPALAELALSLKAKGFAGPFVAADARWAHAAGGTPAQELAVALSAAVAYLRALSQNGFALADAAAAISFRLAADCDQFVTLSKFRAMRLLWARVLQACGLAPRPARIHAESAWRMMTARDPYVNVMRGAMAAFAAGLGGADSVSVLPFTQALGLPDALARRLARNTQLILLQESNLGFVADPAAGAGAFEALTDALCGTAWALFQLLEAEGGATRALRDGGFQQAIAEAGVKLARDVATLRAPLTGVSAHPDLAEARAEVLPAAPPAFSYPGEAVAPPAAAVRVAAAFERLRDASDAAWQRDRARPGVFLATIGAPAAHGRRVGFARELFEAGGLATDADAAGAETAEEAAARFAASGASIACLCGDDQSYADKGEHFAAVLKRAGARYVILAGKPGEREEAWRAAGVDDFVFAGCDALGALERVYRRLGVAF
ncbi:MAG: methylmalonyl-CoA mutase [Hyphomicrobiales bacterium]|nr:methylmalonyl-CoA mutase [Hyphomicrobiales bacterium]